MGGNLASIDNQKEHTFIQDLIRSKTGAMNEAWIGGFDVSGEVRNDNPYEQRGMNSSKVSAKGA